MPRADQLDQLLEAASDQGGYVTTAQARRLGVDKLELHRLVLSADLRRVRQAVYALRHAHHRLEDSIAAWLSIDRNRFPWERDRNVVAVLSHATAATLYQMGTIIPLLPALTVPPRYRSTTSARGIELHVANIDDDDWDWLRVDDTLELPTTTPARTIVDLVVSREEPSYITRAINEAVATGRLSVGQVRAAAERRKKHSNALVERVDTLLADIVR